jgi:uncharacterized protein with HEPN domain
MSPDEVIVLDLIRAARLIMMFRQGMDEAEFMADVKTQSAILHQLMVMGEAVKRLSMPYRDQHPHIPWKSIAGMRDVLIHAYDIVDLEEVWKTASEDIPHLLSSLEQLLPNGD